MIQPSLDEVHIDVQSTPDIESLVSLELDIQELEERLELAILPLTDCYSDLSGFGGVCGGNSCFFNYCRFNSAGFCFAAVCLGNTGACFADAAASAGSVCAGNLWGCAGNGSGCLANHCTGNAGACFGNAGGCAVNL